MGVQLTWENAPADSSWDNTEIHRATSETGTYENIGEVPITDTSFYDCGGSTTSWYKIKFTAQSGECSESDFSDPIQGSVRYLYADPTNVARVAGWDVDDLPKTISINDLYRWIGDVSRNLDNVNETVYGRTETFEHIDSTKYLDLNKSIKIPYKKIADSPTVEFKSSITEDTWNSVNEGYDFQVNQETGRFYLYFIPIVNPRRIKDIKISGSFGQTTVPDEIRQLTEILTAIKAFVHLTGGSFDDVTSYQLGEYSESLGEPYTNLRETIKMLEVEKTRLMKTTGTTVTKVRMRLT